MIDFVEPTQRSDRKCGFLQVFGSDMARSYSGEFQFSICISKNANTYYMQYVGAYLIRGGEGSLDVLLERLEKEKVIEPRIAGSFARKYRKFGVDEAEDLRARARRGQIAAKHRVFALSCHPLQPKRRTRF